MTAAWRLDKAKRSRDESFSGVGAQISGGRWNHKGVRVVYASVSLALAALEKFVHVQEEGRGMALVSYRIEIPGSVPIDRARLDDLPGDWRAYPIPRAAQDFGTAWLKKRAKAVLLVPSAIVPAEDNLLLNPEHADFAKIKILSREPFAFDSRMWKRGS